MGAQSTLTNNNPANASRRQSFTITAADIAGMLESEDELMITIFRSKPTGVTKAQHDRQHGRADDVERQYRQLASFSQQASGSFAGHTFSKLAAQNQLASDEARRLSGGGQEHDRRHEQLY
jgi:hypothetical protein